MYQNIQSNLLIVLTLTIASQFGSSAAADWPWTKWEGSPRIDPIPPVGNRLPDSYRRTYNRPSYLGGKLAAKFEPSSQEAMAFHRAESLGLYDHSGIKGFMNGKNCPPRRVEQHYFYPKPWEVLRVGARRESTPNASLDLNPPSTPLQLDAPEADWDAPIDEAELEIMELPAAVPSLLPPN